MVANQEIQTVSNASISMQPSFYFLTLDTTYFCITLFVYKRITTSNISAIKNIERI